MQSGTLGAAVLATWMGAGQFGAGFFYCFKTCFRQFYVDSEKKKLLYNFFGLGKSFQFFSTFLFDFKNQSRISLMKQFARIENVVFTSGRLTNLTFSIAHWLSDKRPQRAARCVGAGRCPARLARLFLAGP